MAKKRKRRRRAPVSRQARQGPPVRPTAAEAEDAPRSQPARGRGAKGPPPPPWGSFPLSELVIFVAIVLLLGGFFTGPPQGAVMLGAGLVLGSLAGLELAVREHFAGYRSHTILLAGLAGVATLAVLVTLTGLHPAACVAAGAAVFGVLVWVLANAFRDRSGGSYFRFGGG